MHIWVNSLEVKKKPARTEELLQNIIVANIIIVTFKESKSAFQFIFKIKQSCIL
jgi:hypothetical protein